jgi:hypothetical protein
MIHRKLCAAFQFVFYSKRINLGSELPFWYARRWYNLFVSVTVAPRVENRQDRRKSNRAGAIMVAIRFRSTSLLSPSSPLTYDLSLAFRVRHEAVQASLGRKKPLRRKEMENDERAKMN